MQICDIPFGTTDWTQVAETLHPGDRVRINSGSYKELEAIFLARDGAERIVILLQLLHRIR